MTEPIDVFISFARRDEALRDELARHLSALKREGVIRAWHDGCVVAGAPREQAIRAQLSAARIVLLLVSADFLASDFCNDVEVRLAIARQREGAARVIPIVVRACVWASAPFNGLQSLPRNGLAVTSWPNRDEAWRNVVVSIRSAVQQLTGGPLQPLAPNYPDERTRRLSEELGHMQERKRRLQDAGEATTHLDHEIRAKRRELRDGGQLRAGDWLGDGRYLLLDKVGKGGFGVVWRALDRQESRYVAVKVLFSELAADQIRRDRLFRGARAMGRLTGDAVVRVLQPYGEDGGYYYFVMDLLTGGDLRQAVLEHRLSREEVLPIVLRVGDALNRAHALGLVHRDVKPANILLDSSKSPWLTDFDLVTGLLDSTGGTKTGAVLGTPIYAAPELLLRPQEAGPRADVYSLGMTAVFGLRGAELTMLFSVGAKRIIEELPCSEAVKAVLERAVAHDEEDRFESVQAFCEALRSAITPAVEPAPEDRRGEAARSRPSWPTVSFVALTSLATAGGAISVTKELWMPLLAAWTSPIVETAQAAPFEQTTSWASGGAATVAGMKAPPPPPPAPKCPPSMVHIPEGTFGMTFNGVRRDVTLRAYCIDRMEVTAGQYRLCVEAGKCKAYKGSQYCTWGESAFESHPINCISFKQATEYCTWAGRRLPTEAEWQHAAEGRGSSTYPWGDEAPSATRLNACGQECAKRYFNTVSSPMYREDDKFYETAPVGNYPGGASRFGLLDMAGNVSEWTIGEQGAAARGGSWISEQMADVRVAGRRLSLSEASNDLRVGFRCVGTPSQ